MIYLEGTITNVFLSPEGIAKDGTKFGGEHKVQIMHENTLRNGEKQIELLDIVVKNPEQFQRHKNSIVLMAVSAWSRAGDSTVRYQAVDDIPPRFPSPVKTAA